MREIICERTKAGLRRAKREGKRFGRPRLNGMTTWKVREFRREGLTYRMISERTGVSISKISEVLKDPVHKRSVL